MSSCLAAYPGNSKSSFSAGDAIRAWDRAVDASVAHWGEDCQNVVERAVDRTLVESADAFLSQSFSTLVKKERGLRIQRQSKDQEHTPTYSGAQSYSKDEYGVAPAEEVGDYGIVRTSYSTSTGYAGLTSWQRFAEDRKGREEREVRVRVRVSAKHTNTTGLKDTETVISRADGADDSSDVYRSAFYWSGVLRVRALVDAGSVGEIKGTGRTNTVPTFSDDPTFSASSTLSASSALSTGSNSSTRGGGEGWEGWEGYLGDCNKVVLLLSPDLPPHVQHSMVSDAVEHVGGPGSGQYTQQQGASHFYNVPLGDISVLVQARQVLIDAGKNKYKYKSKSKI